MEFNHNVTGIIDILGVLQGLLFGTMHLLLHTKKNKPTIYLGLFILLFSLEPIPYILNDLGLLQQFPKLELLPVHFHFLAYPLLYIYIQKISVFNTKKPSYWTLTPGLVEIIFGLVIFFLPVATKLALKESWYSTLYFIIGLGYSIFIGVLIIQLISCHKKEVENQFSHLHDKQLIWARQFTYASIFFQLFLLINHFVDNLYLYYFVTIINVILIYWISFKGITQEIVVSLISRFPEFGESLSKDTVNNIDLVEKAMVPDTVREFMTIQDMEEVIQLLDEYSINSQCFLKGNLTIVDVAEAIKIHPKRISHSLNNKKGMNFNTYINRFRVEKAKELFNDHSTDHLSVEGIGIEAGFRSKATFYGAFKKFEGNTPARGRNL